jgi:catechol 2,3-dioxygenase-like lactoylglutathione lyase family enzyme
LNGPLAPLGCGDERRLDLLKRINFVTVPVKDMDRALGFYTKKLGFRVFTDQTMGETRWVELQIPGAETRLVLHPKPTRAPDGLPALALLADNVKATYDDLLAKGVEFTQPPKKEHWGEHASFRDSEGNLVLFAKG